MIDVLRGSDEKNEPMEDRRKDVEGEKKKRGRQREKMKRDNLIE